MRTVQKTITFSVALLLLLVSGQAANAEEAPKADVTVGWSFLKPGSTGDDLIELGTLPKGFHAGVSVNINEWLAIAGDFGWNSKGFPYEAFIANQLFTTYFDGEFGYRGLTFSGGPRFLTRSNRVTGFFHALVGAAQGRVKDRGTAESYFQNRVLSDTYQYNDSVSATSFLVQPGGGADIHITHAVSFRVEGDYQIYVEEGATNDFRLIVGTTFHIR